MAGSTLFRTSGSEHVNWVDSYVTNRADIESENGKAGAKAAADVSTKKSTEKTVDVKETMRIDSILAGIMRKVIIICQQWLLHL